jgi:hypothetical protein
MLANTILASATLLAASDIAAQAKTRCRTSSPMAG